MKKIHDIDKLVIKAKIEMDKLIINKNLLPSMIPQILKDIQKNIINLK